MAERTKADLRAPDAVDAYGTARSSPLVPEHALVHADLHNHTTLSDGKGEPERAFASMRDAGVDVAAITDHTNLPNPFIGSMDEGGWQRVAQLAEAADREGSFVAIRGFEWSHPLLGHINVWDSPSWTSPSATSAEDLRRFYDWLQSPEAAEGLTSFNHPGSRGTVLRFGDFELRPVLQPRMVGLEMFNKTDDYLLGHDGNALSPLVQCLDAGWRPGLIGVTDEHGRNWGRPEGKGRTGLFVRELSRRGVREALQARRTFAARVKGLRLAATLGGVLMGQTVPRPGTGELELVVDLDLGPLSQGMEVSVQLLHWAPVVPRVQEIARHACGHGLLRATVAIDPDEPWIVLRVSDPLSPTPWGTPQPFGSLGRSVAYTSPWWIGAEREISRPAP